MILEAGAVARRWVRRRAAAAEHRRVCRSLWACDRYARRCLV